MIPECVPDCPYRKLLQQEKSSELQKCREQNKRKEKRLKELNKKVITLTIIATVAGTLIGKEALEFVGEWLGLLEGLDIGGGNAVGVFPAPSTLAVFALPLFCRAKRRK